MIVVLVLLALFVLWVIRRRRRARQLAGLVASRPVFSLEPPRRRMSGIKGERL